MKKISIAILAVVVLTACLFAGCNGADGGKITDTQQNLSEAMTGMQDMATDISDMFTNAPDNSMGNLTNATNANSEPAATVTTVTADNVTM